MVGFFVENWPAVDMAVSCRVLRYCAIRWLITRASRCNVMDGSIQQYVLSHTLVMVTGVQVVVRIEWVELSSSSK